MDFFAHQERARRKTKLLVFYFACAVLLITAGVYLGLAAVLEWREQRWGELRWLWRPTLLLYSTLGTLGVIGFGALVKISELRAGGSVVAETLGGRLVPPNTPDPQERRLLNVVEEMSIASGVPVPRAYLLPQEQGINAFAAGHSPSDCVVGVTRGCLRHLTRDELQGVIAHEFSHILNGDMRLNLRLIGLLNGILSLALIGRILLRSGGSGRRSSRDSGGAALVAVGLLLYVLGSIGVFFGSLIKAAVSRQREFLADAASVQFTRNPDGMAGALKKIGALAQGSLLEHPNADEASHMYFANGIGSTWFNAFATHPPLVDRIRAIEPAFDGRFPRLTPPTEITFGPPPAAPARGWPSGPMPIPAAAILASSAGPAPQQLAFAADFRETLSPDLRDAAREPLSASALVLGMLLSRDADSRRAQLAGLDDLLDRPTREELDRLQAALDGLPRRHRLPLLLLAAPALRSLSAEQFTTFETATLYLVEHDSRVELFEFTLQHFVRRQLAAAYRPQPRRMAQVYALRSLTRECGTLLSALAHLSGEDGPAREAAFQRGVAALGNLAEPLALQPLPACGIEQIGQALDRLNDLTPMLKKTVLSGCVNVVAHDGLVQPDEAELLRAIADALDCPIPPVITGL
ncbi:MAG: M48 family metallopeptidase [Verrucomicrobia bacterium]|nr:M48 family metallopeptidase [Verrucomicrobiota bacterium]